MESTEVYHIGGHKVMFPFKPYPSQFDMMNKILSGLDKRLNCLLESPTGSGKTLSLLCSSLAWQKTEAAKIEILNKENQKNICEFCWDPHRYHHTYHLQPKQKTNKKNSKKQCKTSIEEEETTCCNKEADVLEKAEKTSSQQDDDDFRDFSEIVKARHTAQTSSKSSRSHVTIEYENAQETDKEIVDGCGECSDSKGCDIDEQELSYTECDRCFCQCDGSNGNASKKMRVPKIFFGTRTHKQIKQIVGELKETQYKNVKMCILSSRENLCINKEVRSKPSINEACKEYLEHQKCHYINGAMRFSTQNDIRMFGLETAWDIEDLVKICQSKKMKACPYFLTRSLMKDSDIIFCPYNYLLDPTIRKIMEINLKGNIVILDEGHNIEDSCREAISYTVTTSLLTILIKELTDLVRSKVNTNDFQYLLDLVHSLHSFIHKRSADLQQTDFNQASKIWSGFEAVAELVHLKIGPKDISNLSVHLKHIRDEAEKRKKKMMFYPKLSSAAFQMFEQLLVSLTYFYMNDLKNVEDFRLVLLRNVTFGPKKGTRSKSRVENFGPKEELTLCLWCLNPGVTFSDFSGTRSVIITSGTLSPMVSFQSELEFPFSVRMEARHVIPPSQVLVRAIGCGPSGRSLVATYKHTETFAFQDDLGDIVCDVCMRTPNGVLCFLSSYSLLDKLCKRWQAIGLWEKIGERKLIVMEPRTGKKEDFTKAWQKFKLYAQGDFTDSMEENEDITQDGALFLAVCRGKLSEGIDFADNSARTVITVGIPYPNVKDIQVSLKKEYNELHKRTKNLLPGNDWLEIQAFRALNQALGRCIRHKNDWGALLLVDSRFLQGNRYHKGLSKWVRDMLKSQPNYTVAMQSLTAFMKDKMKANSSLQEKSSHSIENNRPSSDNLHMEPILSSTPIAKRSYSVHPEGKPNKNNLTPEGHLEDSNKPAQDAELSSVLAACSPSSKSDADFVETVPQSSKHFSSLVHQPELVPETSKQSDEVNSCSHSKTSKDSGLTNISPSKSKAQMKATEDCQSKNSKLAAGCVEVHKSEISGKDTECNTETILKCSQISSENGSPVLFNDLNDSTDDAELLSMVESEAEKSITKEFNWSDELSESSSSSPNKIAAENDLNETLKKMGKGKHSTLRVPQKSSLESSAEMFNEDPDLMTFIENSTKIDSFSSVISSSSSQKEPKGDNNKIEDTNSSTQLNHKLQRCPLFKAASNHPHVSSTQTSAKNDLQGSHRLSSADRDPFAELLSFESQELKLKHSAGRKRRPSSNHVKYNKKSRGIAYDSAEEKKHKEELVILCKNCHRNLFSVHSNIEKRSRLPPLVKDIFTDMQRVFLYLAANTSDQLHSVSTMKFQIGNGAALNSCWFPKYGCCIEYLQCICNHGTKQTLGVRVLLGSTDYPTGQLWLLDEAVKINSVHD
ncbi:Fanconi anemia group J protein homolog [Octopus sinensis]|uniref:DNA 5'-3' helicase n=1 Tax=Octopus sinensis TaxID=2607531 RepID=A0A6P7SI42_9MOLL|nr:Fanconi anemia group J protein homolog [Octopus sinensis]